MIDNPNISGSSHTTAILLTSIGFIILPICLFILAKAEDREFKLTRCRKRYICTYSFTGPKWCYQTWYSCQTCHHFKLKDAICQICSQRCHQGHNLIEHEGWNYCKCGHRLCTALKRTSLDSLMKNILVTKIPVDDVLNLILEYNDSVKKCYRATRCTFRLGDQEQEYYICKTCSQVKGFDASSLIYEIICLVCAEKCHFEHILEKSRVQKEILCGCTKCRKYI